MTLDETMFLIEHNLCTMYAGLTPFTIECETYHNVIMLYADVRRMQIREAKKEKGGKRVIRRPAGDDWF